MRVVVYNLGCKVNQYECDSLIRELQERGFDVADSLQFADVFILNTCAVTSEAERKSRQCVARCRKFNEKARIIVCGCASQNNAKQFAEKDGVYYVSGVADKAKLVDKLQENGVFVAELPKIYEDNMVSNSLRTRSYVKVQDGCDNFCSYCLIPYLRGRNRSRAIESVVNECKSIAAFSREIVLTGINLSAYGKDSGSSLLALALALKEVGARIRFGSLEVGVITEEFLAGLATLQNFCPQFHLSLQSGCDSVLVAMNRHYTTAQYFDKVVLIRKYFAQASITTDLICGFVGESEADFETTLAFIAKVGFADMHIFPYSPRSGTKAYVLGSLGGDVVSTRAKRAEAVAEQMRKAFCKSQLGQKQEVIFEDSDDNMMVGFSRNYTRVYADCGSVVKGELTEVMPSQLFRDGIR